MSYRTNLLDWYRQVGIYASRILNGEKPATCRSCSRRSSTLSSISRWNNAGLFPQLGTRKTVSPAARDRGACRRKAGRHADYPRGLRGAVPRHSAAQRRAGTARARPEGGSLSQLFGTAKYKNRNRHGNPDAYTKTCPDSNANANVSHRCTDTCTKYNTNEYAQRQSSYAPA